MSAVLNDEIKKSQKGQGTPETMGVRAIIILGGRDDLPESLCSNV